MTVGEKDSKNKESPFPASCLGAKVVQMAINGMENMELVDDTTPKYWTV